MYRDATPTQKATSNSLFSSFHGMCLRERNGSILTREMILFLVNSTVYAHSNFVVQKSKADQMLLFYFHCFLTPSRECLQKNIGHLNLQSKGRILELKNQKPWPMLLWTKCFFVCACVFQ